MGILDDLKADAEKPLFDRCPIGRFLRSLPPEECDEWTFALSMESGFSHALVHKHLAERIPGIGQNAVQRHRRGECRCGD